MHLLGRNFGFVSLGVPLCPAFVIECGTEDVQCFWSSFLRCIETGGNGFSEFYTAVIVQDFICRCAQ